MNFISTAEKPLRIGASRAEIVIFNKGGRAIRYHRLERAEEAPREFFYGFLELEKAGLSAAMLSSAGAFPGVLGRAVDAAERAAVSFSNFGIRPLSAALHLATTKSAKVVISFTDGFSLSLGLASKMRSSGQVLIGGFHGLSDIEGRVKPLFRPIARKLIARSLAGLDHVFFFGPADREYAIDAFGLSREHSSVIKFGVDTEFWRPCECIVENFVIAVGQDLNRDYELLAAAPGRHKIIIITRQKVRVPEGADNVTVTAGDYFGSDSMSDHDLRNLYNRACGVVVPLKDVYQPSGYSVTLQAMSCGRPVILTETRGLWAPELFRDGVNCLLVPPNDAAALGAAIGKLRSDPGFAQQIGRTARDTVVQHFNLAAMGADMVRLARRGLAFSANSSGTAGSISPIT